MMRYIYLSILVLLLFGCNPEFKPITDWEVDDLKGPVKTMFFETEQKVATKYYNPNGYVDSVIITKGGAFVQRELFTRDSAQFLKRSITYNGGNLIKDTHYELDKEAFTLTFKDVWTEMSLT